VKLHISDTLSLPLEFVTSTQAILAKKRVGKSYTASVQAEELLKLGQQICAIDPTGAWSGLKSSADGKHPGFPIVVFGGERGDVPLEETAGEIIATSLVEQRFSAILDVSLFRKGAMTRFMADFLEVLYHRNREAMHLFVDEADMFCPQKPFKGQERTLGAMEDVVRRGGIRGIGCTLITQRSAVINKDVLTQVGLLTVLRLSHPRDIEPIREWVGVHGDEEEFAKMKESLPSLERGTAWVWAPEWDLFKKVKIRERETFDSGATPKPGEAKRKPKVTAEIDIAKLGEQIKATIEKVKADDPNLLKREIQKLKADLLKRPSTVEEKIVEKVVEVPTLGIVEAEALQTFVSNLSSAVSTIGEIAASLQKSVQDAQRLRPTAQATRQIQRGTPSPPQNRPVPVSRSSEIRTQSNGKLRAGAERMLSTLVQWFPQSIAEGRLRAHAGLKKSGTYSTYKSDMITGGYAELRGDGLAATQAGVDYFGNSIPSTPMSTEEVLATWRPKLREGARRMLDVLVSYQGKEITRDQLFEESGLVASGTASTYLSDLRTAQLAVTTRDAVAANVETLFL
jgi:hypothetical protein